MKKQINQFPERWWPSLLIMGVIFLASSTPGKEMPSFGLADTLIKKGGHMTGYFLLTLSALRGIHQSGKKASALAMALALLYAISDEFHQTFIPGRHPSTFDVLIDMTGAGLALWAEQAFPWLRKIIGRDNL